MFLVSSCNCLSSIHRNKMLSWEWRRSWGSADRWGSNYIWVINNLLPTKVRLIFRGFAVPQITKSNVSLLIQVLLQRNLCEAIIHPGLTGQVVFHDRVNKHDFVMTAAKQTAKFKYFFKTSPGCWFNIKMVSYQYRKSHCRGKTVIRSTYLHHGISYTGKMTSLYMYMY